jgi:hypothetical protein
MSDSIDDDVRAKLNEAVSVALEQPGANFLLVDASALSGVIDQVDAAGLAWRPLRDGVSRTAAAALPGIVAWPKKPTHKQRRWLERLCHALAFRHGLSLLGSELQPEDLVSRLIRRTRARTVDGQDLFLRFADTRTFEALGGALPSDVLASFTSLTARWAWVDRQGLLQTSPCACSRQETWPDPCVIAEAHFAALMTASEIDQVMHLIATNSGEVLAAWPRAEWHAKVEGALRKARGWHLESAPDLAACCTLYLLQGDELDDSPAGERARERVARKEITMQQALEQLDAP